MGIKHIHIFGLFEWRLLSLASEQSRICCFTNETAPEDLVQPRRLANAELAWELSINNNDDDDDGMWLVFLVVATQIFFIFPPYYLGKWSNLTSIFFQMGWFNQHLVLNAVVFTRTALEEEWRLNTLRTPFGTKKQPGGSSKLDHGWVQITDQSMICWNLIGMNVHGKKTSSQANRDDMKGTETRSFCMFLSSRNDWWVQRISFDATDCLRPAMEAKFPIEAPNSFLWRIKQNGIFPLLVLVPERFIGFSFNFGVNFLGWKEFHWTPFSSAWHAKR